VNAEERDARIKVLLDFKIALSRFAHLGVDDDWPQRDALPLPRLARLAQRTSLEQWRETLGVARALAEAVEQKRIEDAVGLALKLGGYRWQAEFATKEIVRAIPIGLKQIQRARSSAFKRWPGRTESSGSERRKAFRAQRALMRRQNPTWTRDRVIDELRSWAAVHEPPWCGKGGGLLSRSSVYKILKGRR
jgi:hypothetical protein